MLYMIYMKLDPFKIFETMYKQTFLFLELQDLGHCSVSSYFRWHKTAGYLIECDLGTIEYLFPCNIECGFLYFYAFSGD